LIDLKAKKWVDGRKGLLEKMKAQIEINDEIVWFHCASLGEFEQGLPIIKKIKDENTNYKILVTFFSPSGYDIIKDREDVDYVFYLPEDSRGNAESFLQIVKPKMAIFVKYEFWYHYIMALEKNNIPAFLVSAVFRKNQLFFKSYGGMFMKMLKTYKRIFVQDAGSQKLLETSGLTNSIISGDTRFDRVYQNSVEAKPIPIVEKFKGNRNLFIAGSTWPKDEKIIVDYINKEASEMKFIIAPHEIGENNIMRLQNQIKLRSVRYSEADKEDLEKCEVLIIDNIGMLSSIYQYAYISYIGGGFGSSIHNMLEAAVFGVPVVMGPNYHKNIEAVDLITDGGAFSISTSKEFEGNMKFLLGDRFVQKIAAEISRMYVKKHRGASEIIAAGLQI